MITDPTAQADGFNQPHLLLTVAQAAEQLQVSRWTVYQLIHKKKLETIKLGSARRIPASALDACIAHLLETGGADL